MLPQTSNFLCQSCTRPTRERETETIHPAYGSLTPLIFSSTGGLTKEVIIFYKRLASPFVQKTETAVQCHYGLAKMRDVILTVEIHYFMLPRTQISCWESCEG